MKILSIDDNQDTLITVEAVLEDAFSDAQILTALEWTAEAATSAILATILTELKGTGKKTNGTR